MRCVTSGDLLTRARKTTLRFVPEGISSSDSVSRVVAVKAWNESDRNREVSSFCVSYVSPQSRVEVIGMVRDITVSSVRSSSIRLPTTA